MKEVRDNKRFYLLLPALVFPFLTLLFWSLGGGRETQAQAQQKQGLDMTLPQTALRSEDKLTKLDYYNRAHADTVKFRELMRTDLNYKKVGLEDESLKRMAFKGLNTSLDGEGASAENQIVDKLAELEKVISTPPAATTPVLSVSSSQTVSSPEIERLEAMMQMMNNSESEDQQLAQLSGMLESILDIQHPERVQQRNMDQKSQRPVLRLQSVSDDVQYSLLQAENETAAENEFYSWSEEDALDTPRNTLRAVVHQTQTVVSGSTVKLRLTQDAVLGKQRLYKDTFIYGKVLLSGERLKIVLDHIVIGENIYPVDLTVHDLDGLEGIYVPGAIARDAVKQSTDGSLSSIGIGSLDPTLGAQAASAGIEVAKNILSKKVKLIKVTLKEGYQVYLRNATDQMIAL